MPFLRQVVFVLAVAALVVSAAHAGIQFVGILVTPQQTVFTLLDDSTGRSGWRKLGETFAGYGLTAYDTKDDTITLTKDGATTRVRLKDAKIQSARVEIAGTFTLGHGENLEVLRATVVLGEETVFPLKDGFVFRLKPERRPDGDILYRSSFERPLPDGTVERFAAPAVIAAPGARFSVTAGEFGFSFGLTAP